VAAAVAQEAICTIMSSSADHDFELSLQSYASNNNGLQLKGEPTANSDKSAANALKSSHKSMYDSYQVWALKTYGDSAKTKTVTKKKYNRILKILKGEEGTNVENSKFRFWVKAKGFRLGPQNLAALELKSIAEQVLYVPCSKSTQVCTHVLLICFSFCYFLYKSLLMLSQNTDSFGLRYG
jgi:hypothetical protein